ncbi:MAG: ECF transporter S component [Ruminococcaceae bacterium]|nr:ECF transporter S component [Oscillospiraceae bacterium]
MKHTKKLVLTALFAALTFCATFVMKIPTPTGGYVNLGDSFVLTSAWVLGSGYGIIAAALGSALADLLGGYPIYILPTFIIKGLMAFVAWGLFRLIAIKKTFVSRIIGAIVAEIIMVGGYYLVEAVFLGYGFGGALVSVPANAVQAVFGVVSGVLITEVLMNVKATQRFLNQ